MRKVLGNTTIAISHDKSLGLKIYIIAILFSSLSIFIQSIPITTADNFESALLLSHSKFVYLTSLFFIPYSIMQLPGGILFDKYGLKYILPSAIFITSIGIVLYWFAPTTSVLVASRFIAGFGCSVAYIAGVYAAARYFSSKKLAILISILELVSTAGSLVAANPLAFGLKHLGWNITGFIIISIYLGLFICALVFAKKLPSQNYSHLSLWQSLLNAFTLFKNKSLLCIFAYSFLTWYVIMSFAGYWLHDYLMIMHNYSNSYSLSMVETYWMSFLITSFIIGYCTKSDKSAKVNLLIVAGLGVLAFAIMAIPVLFNRLEILLVILAAGISATGIIIAFSLVPRFVAAELEGTAVAMNNTFVVFGGYCGQVSFGWMVNHFDISNYFDIIHDKNIDHNHYSALSLYVIATALSFIFAILITRNIDKHPQGKI
ncbi:MAG: MFS transporter [Burkholderiales bacterium]|nr:MFS transporter [Burkholderiales bacterium]